MAVWDPLATQAFFIGKKGWLKKHPTISNKYDWDCDPDAEPFKVDVTEDGKILQA